MKKILVFITGTLISTIGAFQLARFIIVNPEINPHSSGFLLGSALLFSIGILILFSGKKIKK